MTRRGQDAQQPLLGVGAPVRLICGDSSAVLPTLAEASVEAVVTDPPYGLSSAGPDAVAACLAAWAAGEPYRVPDGQGGFMGAAWDAWVPGPELWRAVLRVLKPGGYAVVFAGARTQDLMGVALRLAGFEVRDCLQWVYAGGFPKNLDVSKALDKQAGVERAVLGYRRGQGHIPNDCGEWGLKANQPVAVTTPATEAAQQWDGWGTALKPSYEPVLLCRKPLEGTVARNVLKHGTGALNIDACRVPTSAEDAAAMARCNTPGSGQLRGRDPVSRIRGEAGSEAAARPLDTTQGRWPANVVHDGSAEVEAAFAAFKVTGQRVLITGREPSVPTQFQGQVDSAARFFYTAKASGEDREFANDHPTVKPLALMRWLVRLVTRPGGTVLDPFMGSGSTGRACAAEGMGFIGIERERQYAEIAQRRLLAKALDVMP